ncbi:GLUTAMATE RECEPTOR 2.7, glutamate receptor 2.7 [Hibiscus trionum]|uniref:Glutamate receptor n=1 Tax=Hibiscus trionum TaxID=183268 RepID=A0A9W7J370_HIBTR|nr:GLUTAMATE RECEPTOR 2.7, glutamate receptor 2.7 [Hibiscus trionum]
MPNHFWFSCFLFIFFSSFFTIKSETGGSSSSSGPNAESTKSVYDIDIVGTDSKMGAMLNTCMSMALSDFYAKHPNYETRLSLRRWAASAVGNLPPTSAEASFAIKLADCSPSASPFLITTSMADFSRPAKAIVATFEMFDSNQVVLVHEDIEFSNAIIPYVTDALDNKGIKLSHKTAIPTSAQTSQILEELQVLMTLPSKVFVVVHMSASLASRFFAVANEAGMMSKGLTWLVTFVDTMDPNPIAADSMKGVIGLRPYVPATKGIKNFRTRYKRLSMMMQNNEATELNLFGLRVYDIVYGLATTVERRNGRNWLMGMLNTSYRGVSGDFELVNGQIQPLVFEIFNITKEGKRMIGYWTHDRGMSKNLYPNSTNTEYIRRALEENESTESKWIIGVPSKAGFKEFVNIQPGDKKGDGYEPGFTIEVFKAVWKSSGLPPDGYEFVTMDGTYGDLCCKVKAKEIHAAVGDISIVASRTNCVDFTLPYLESGVAMLIKVRHDGPNDMWIFLKPLSWDLWLVIIGIGIFIGIVVRVLERRDNTEFTGSPRNQLSKILMFPCLSVAIPQRDMAATNCSRLVLVVWIFLAFILMQSYTANLSSILTVNQLQATIPSIRELRNCHVGYQNLSFVKDFLINQFGFKEAMLKPYGSVDDFQEALSKGSDNGGVSVIFDEIPYIRLFVAQYTTGYMMVGPTYRTDGLGFALPIGSPLVANFSRAILNFTQGKYMAPIEKKYFGVVSIDQDDTGSVSSASPSLTSRSFAGLFIIIAIIVFLALLSSKNHMFGRLVRRYIFRNSRDNGGSRVQPTAEMTVASITNPPEISNVEENHNSNQGHIDESADEATLEVHSPS